MGAVVAFAALVGLIVWLVVESRGGSSSEPKPEANQPAVVSDAGLKTLAGVLGQPIYWVGPRANEMYELTQTSNGVYVRYLPQGASAADPSELLTIGTYSVLNAYDTMRTNAGQPGAKVLDVPGGGIAVINDQYPSSVYVAYPQSNYQIEVYDPDPAVARRLAVKGRLRTVLNDAASEVRGPVAASPKELRSLAASLGHPVYWAGPRANTTYELTQTADGRTYVRYLPRGRAAGDTGGFLTVGTYPLAEAYDVTKSGVGPDSVTINLSGGGIAVYSKGQATNVHLAYPDADVQVEVYDPSGAVPPRLVARGRIVPVG